MNTMAKISTMSGKAYNGCTYNCSTFAQSVLKLAYPKLDASQAITPTGALRLLYNDSRTVAPNNLYNAAMSLPNASNLKGPNSVTAKPYLKYFGK